MKKFKNIFVLFLSFILISAASVQFNAVTIYRTDGYSYTEVGKGMISLYDWDNRSTTLTVPDKLGNLYFSEIGDFSLRNNSVITALDLIGAKHLSRIGVMAFENCSKISGEVVIPSCVNEIGLGAFQNCSSLETATIYASVKAIPAQCFYKCSSLENVTLPSFLTSIDKFAFADCTSLKSISIPKGVTEINPTAFQNDTDLEIRCYTDSYAHKFALENNYKYFLVDRITGDVNGDGNIDIMDVTRIQKYRADILKLDKNELIRADVNGDGEVTIRDATLIQMYCAGKITKFN